MYAKIVGAFLGGLVVGGALVGIFAHKKQQELIKATDAHVQEITAAYSRREKEAMAVINNTAPKSKQVRLEDQIKEIQEAIIERQGYTPPTGDEMEPPHDEEEYPGESDPIQYITRQAFEASSYEKQTLNWYIDDIVLTDESDVTIEDYYRYVGTLLDDVNEVGKTLYIINHDLETAYEIGTFDEIFGYEEELGHFRD